MDTIRIYIVRHGETEENKQKIIQGQLDTALNFEGERQADLVAKALKDIPFDACYSSDLRRAVDTAKRILVYHSGVEVQTQTAVRERYMGDLEGRAFGNFKDLIAKKGEKKEIKEPESVESVTKRAVTWWNETIGAPETGTTASCVLIVSHGAWIRLLVEGLLERKAVRAAHGVTVGRCLNTGVSVVQIPRERGRGQLVQFGNVRHLWEAEVDTLESNADDEVGEGDNPGTEESEPVRRVM
ncbi:histidine phosphatase superfamily [Russula dissimulans]|nr:histidine phosphatase superfamily [Russula dissimulans]